MVKPSFFIVGAPKSGTTTLLYNLRQQPGIFMPECEMNFWCDEFYKDRNYLNTVSEYESYFMNAKQDQILGEKSVKYFYSEDAIKKIIVYNPEAKFIIILRNHEDMFQSMHGQLLYSGSEEHADPNLVWDLNFRKNINTIKDENNFTYKKLCSIGKQTSDILSLVGKEKLLVLFLHDLQKQPEKVYREIENFLGLQEPIKFSTAIQNQKKQHRSLLCSKAISIVGQVKNKLGIRKRFFVLSKIRKLNTVKAKDQIVLSDSTRQSIEHYFAEDLKILKNALETQLSHWR